LFLAPTTFTAVGDKETFFPPAAVLQNGWVIPIDYPIFLGVTTPNTALYAYSNDISTIIELSPTNAHCWGQLRMRQGYQPVSAESFRLRLQGFEVS